MTGKPRLAIVVPNLMIGGTERHLLAVLPRLAARGYAIDILTTRGPGALDDAFVAQGISVHHPGRFARLGKAGVIASLALALFRCRPDIVHFFLSEAYLLGTIAALLVGVPRRVMSRRSQNLYQRKYPLFAVVERRLHRTVHAVLGNSLAVCAELADEGVPAARLGLIANGVDTRRFAPGDRRAARTALGLPGDALVMVVVANLNAYKGHADLLEALAAAGDRLPPDWILLCVGRDASLGPSLRERAVRLGIADHIRWAGEQPDVVPWLQAADMALLCSHEEGSPNSLIEAMAVGLPIVATDVGGVADIVGEGETGHLVPPHEPERLAERISDIASDAARRVEMSGAARERVERRFSIDRCVEAYAALYDRLAGVRSIETGKSREISENRQKRKTGLFRTAVKIGVSLALFITAVIVLIDRADTPEILATVRALPGSAILFVVLALCIGSLLAAARLKLISGDLGYRLNWRDALAALGLGQLGGALFFQIAGQLAARGAFLSGRGVPVSATVLTVGYERLLAMIVSLSLAGIGAWHVFGRIVLDIDSGGDELIKLATGILLAIAAGAWLGWGRVALETGSALIDGAHLYRILRVALLSLSIQATTAFAYFVLAHRMAPDISIFDLVAAIFVVMFAAALPISFAGWGVRELGAIFALGMVGVPASAAIVTATIVGIGSLLVAIPLGGLALSGHRTATPAVSVPGKPTTDFTRLLSVAIPLAVATAVFFNIHLPTEAGGLNVTLADPVALLGGALFVIFAIWHPRALPAWRLSGFNLHILLATLVLTAALFIGATRFGWTDWAVTNKYFGWYVLLAYGATGALIARSAGTDGGGLLLTTFVAAGLAVAGLELLLEFLRSVGVTLSERILYFDATGFAANRNAFAFQMLMVGAVTIALRWRGRAADIALGTVFAAMWFSGSRAGWGSFALLAATAIFTGVLSWRRAVGAVVVGTGFTLAIEFAWVLQLLWTDDFGQVLARVADRSSAIFISDSTMNERLKSYEGAWRLFSEHPLFGAGLGAHIERALRAAGTPLVIHSTTLWLAAETGLVGLIVFLTPIARVFRNEIARVRDDRAACLLVLAIATFATMSLVHEMLYQRTFWLLLGAGLAWLPAPADTGDRPASRA